MLPIKPEIPYTAFFVAKAISNYNILFMIGVEKKPIINEIGNTKKVKEFKYFHYMMFIDIITN